MFYHKLNAMEGIICELSIIVDVTVNAAFRAPLAIVAYSFFMS
jgi:hypothetical protein